MIDDRPKPPTRATTFTRWAEAKTLMTNAAPTAPGSGRRGTTRRMTTQPGTKNRIGQTRTIAVGGTAQASAPAARMPSSSAPMLEGDGASVASPATAGGSTAGR